MMNCNKIKAFFRLGLVNMTYIILYYLKKMVGWKTSNFENSFYQYYNYLAQFDGVPNYIRKDLTATVFKSIQSSPIKLRFYPSSDLNVFHQIFFWKEYEPVIHIFKEKYIKIAPDYILDCGANIGLTSLYFKKFFSNSKIFCFEPEVNNYELLRYNLQEYKNVKCLNVGVWKNNTKLTKSDNFRDNKDWSFRLEDCKKKGIYQVYSIPYLMKKYNIPRIDILKIDIEGSEADIFKKETDLEFLKKTRCLIMEIHEEFSSRNDIESILKAYDFEIYNKGEFTIGVRSLGL